MAPTRGENLLRLILVLAAIPWGTPAAHTPVVGNASDGLVDEDVTKITAADSTPNRAVLLAKHRLLRLLSPILTLASCRGRPVRGGILEHRGSRTRRSGATCACDVGPTSYSFSVKFHRYTRSKYESNNAPRFPLAFKQSDIID